MTFHDDEHRINNTGWIRNGDEMEGWNEKQNHRENAERFSIYIFLHQQWKQCLEFALAKLRRICKYLAGACNSNSHARGLATLSYFCLQNQGRKISTMRRVISEYVLKRAQHYPRVECEEVSLQIEFATLPPKTTTSLWKLEQIGRASCRERVWIPV